MLDQKLYIEMFSTWANMNYREPENISEILRQSIWDNDLNTHRRQNYTIPNMEPSRDILYSRSH